VPSLGTREVFAFGEGVALPTRLRFKELERHHIPHSEAISRASMDSARGVDVGFLLSVVERWRGATMAARSRHEDDGTDIDALAGQEFSQVRQPAAVPQGAASPPLAPKPAAMTPDQFFFPVDEGPKPQPFPRLRK
jgi:hypothetical protein